MRKLIKHKMIIICIAFALFTGAGFYNGLTVRHISIPSGKIHTPVRVLLLTDLHSCKYGKNQSALIKAIDRQHPDIILMSGDMVDDGLPEEPAYEFFRRIAPRYPSYYVTGNHEFWTWKIDDVKRDIRDCGITVLEGDTKKITIGGQQIQIAGVDDPEAGKTTYKSQLERVRARLSSEVYTILLSHRPERFSEYDGFDLTLSGHAHGGQWRIPFAVFAPDQGFFPKYSSGLYSSDNANMFVSRGLARETTIVPRIFNTPEIVVIDLSAL
ncbi:phosphoesterase [Clostridia bacterium]|nr:phosphoesterase [Clostridia bacterium]